MKREEGGRIHDERASWRIGGGAPIQNTDLNFIFEQYGLSTPRFQHIEIHVLSMETADAKENRAVS